MTEHFIVVYKKKGGEGGFYRFRNPFLVLAMECHVDFHTVGKECRSMLGYKAFLLCVKGRGYKQGDDSKAERDGDLGDFLFLSFWRRINHR